MDSPQQSQPVNNKINPVLLIFLIFPIIGIVVAVVTTLNANSGASTPQPPASYFKPTTLIGSTAPDFTLQTPDGKTVSLTSLRGRWVFLNFWATWCAPCRDEMPTFQKLLDGGFGPYGDKLTVLAVDRVEQPDTVKKYMSDLNLSVPVAMDVDGQVNDLYDVINLPRTFLIDPSGMIRYEQPGPVTADYIRQYLSKEIGSQTSF
jgi:peroxiredoxin